MQWINIDPIIMQDISEVLGLSEGNSMTVGNGKYLSNNVSIDVIDNNNGTFTLDRQ